MCSKLKDDLTITIATAKKWSDEIMKAGGGIPFDQLLEMNIADFILTCGRNKLDLVFKEELKDNKTPKFLNLIKYCYSKSDHNSYIKEGFTFIGEGFDKDDNEVSYFVKE